jgi:hypothetical protein
MRSIVEEFIDEGVFCLEQGDSFRYLEVMKYEADFREFIQKSENVVFQQDYDEVEDYYNVTITAVPGKVKEAVNDLKAFLTFIRL